MGDIKNKNDLELSDYLAALGQRVREARAKRGMARRILARDSGVSERYLAQLESGAGNPSITVLRQIADAVDYPLAELVTGTGPGVPRDPDGLRGEVNALLAKLPETLLPAIVHDLKVQVADVTKAGKGQRIALIGLRGAGKSTLGQMLATTLGVPFVELNRLVEQDYGGSVGEILALSGQSAFRRIELRCLERVISENDSVVIATGGGIVSEPGTYQVLRDRCHTVWLQASPQDHMDRVIAQGDLRPMARNNEAMVDLKAILEARDPDYRLADQALDTSGKSEAVSAASLLKIARVLIGSSET